MASATSVSVKLEPDNEVKVEEEPEDEDDGTLFSGSQDAHSAGIYGTPARPQKSLLWPEIVMVDWEDHDEDSGVADDPLSLERFCQVTMEGSADDDVSMEAGESSSIKADSEDTLFTDPLSNNICEYITKRAGFQMGKKARRRGRIHSCTMCDYKTRTRMDFKQHQKIHAAEKCEICDHVFSEAKEAETHTCDKPYTCNFCNFRSRAAYSLRRHEKIHSDYKPYFCSFCNLSFYRTCHLKQHMRIHTGERPFACEICNYRFTQTSTLNRHMKTHTGEKPYSCETCGRQFRQKCQVKKHMRTHYEYACRLCDSKFVEEASLTYHLRITHSVETGLS